MPTPADRIGSGRWPLTELWDFKHTRGTDWLTAAISAGGELGSRSGSWDLSLDGPQDPATNQKWV